MKILLVIIGLAFSTCVLSQNKITGRWKPVFFSMGKMMTADIKADTVFLSDTVDVIVKDDKDPAASKELLQMMAGAVLRKMKNMEQEFSSSGVYTEVNKKSNTSKTGTYTFDAATNLLTTVLDGVTAKYTVSFKKDHLVLTAEVGSNPDKRGEMIIEYEKM